ncbi:sentrin-specific protease 1-like [Abeliophyllum distichum]|uniref:Sentrin-specific protease 1-like n=1 Tax=Abeliophyllum distichum TaxID=126358 RepID=A0ABD1RTM8_9LAMI
MGRNWSRQQRGELWAKGQWWVAGQSGIAAAWRKASDNGGLPVRLGEQQRGELWAKGEIAWIAVVEKRRIWSSFDKKGGVSFANRKGVVEDRVCLVSRDSSRSDCGLFTVKFIEFSLVGLDLNLVQPKHMLMWRQKMAAKIFRGEFDL